MTKLIQQGAVAVCARDYYQAGYEAGEMGFNVLSGKNPAEIPNHNVKKTEYLINQETARQFQIDLPDKLLTAFPNLKIIKQ